MRGAVLVYVLAAQPAPDDLDALRRADREEVPIVCLTRPDVDEVPETGAAVIPARLASDDAGRPAVLRKLARAPEAAVKKVQEPPAAKLEEPGIETVRGAGYCVNPEGG